MKQLLHKDNIATGIITTLISEILCAAMVCIVLLIMGTPFTEHARWFAISFVPPLLLLRHYAKTKDYPTTLKSVISTFFITFVAYMWIMMKYKFITF